MFTDLKIGLISQFALMNFIKEYKFSTKILNDIIGQGREGSGTQTANKSSRKKFATNDRNKNDRCQSDS